MYSRKVGSSQVIPESLLAAEYAKPGTLPALRPMTPFRTGPTAFFDAWCAQGPTHHVALGVGHQLSRVRKIADLLGLALAVVE